MPLLALSLTSLALGALAGAALAAAVAAAAVHWVRKGLTARDPSAESGDLIEHAADVVLVHAPDGSKLEPNQAARTALGLGDWDGLSFLDIAALEGQAVARDHLARLAASGTARSDLRLRSLGPARTFDVVSHRVSGRVLTVARDVADRVESEREARRERDQALDAFREKSAFLDAMSHDLRTPLTAVLGFAELLRDEVDGESRGLVEAIGTGGHRLLQTLDYVLDLARLDAGRQELHPTPLDVAAAVRQAVGPHRPAAHASGLALDVEAFSDHVPATLDAAILDRVVGTLVRNAVAYTETGGVTVEIVDDPETVTLRVLDTGTGIPSDALPKLFSEHRHASGPGEAPVGITALSLAVTRRLVELAGGTISVESLWGQGTAFTVVLPRGPIPELAPAAVPA